MHATVGPLPEVPAADAARIASYEEASAYLDAASRAATELLLDGYVTDAYIVAWRAVAFERRAADLLEGLTSGRDSAPPDQG